MPLESAFKNGDEVSLRSTKEQGRVDREPIRDGGEWWYRVRFFKRVENVVEDDLEPALSDDQTLEAIVLKGAWGRLRAFRTAVAVERIRHASQNTVYSFRAQRVLFQAFQYKPLLKFLESRDGRLLIADEVGVGKTIEAGLILMELEARKRRLERVVVVCPSRLREKWRDELSRKFDQDFDIYDRKNIDEYLERAARSTRRTSLRSIVSMQTLRNEDLRERLLASVDSFDLLIVDEAHHARNPAAQTSQMLQELCERSDAVLLLTATPLHLGNRDLFTLLQALRPAEFRDFEVFDEKLRRFRAIHEAGYLVRTMDPGNLARIEAILADLFETTRDSSDLDPLAMQILAELRENPPTERLAWIDLERRVQELHPLSSIVTRTRKRDVEENAPVRRAEVIRCKFTPAEEEIYKRLVVNTRTVDWIDQKIGLGQVQRARQAASCLPAAVQAASAAAALDDDAIELTDILPSDIAGDRSDSARLPASFIYSGPDSKFEKLCELLDKIHAREPDAKVLVFTFFIGTSRYLQEQLTKRGIRTERIAGDVPSDPKNPDRDERGRVMHAFRDDPAIRILVSTEVGSEGLDFQFCHHLVNYDLPWNPMVVEQRIGRIDRFGQKASVLFIDSLVIEGTVEDRILARLYERIGVFEKSVGQLEAILGETVHELQQEYVDGRLSPDEAEARVLQAERAIANRRAALEELEKNAADLFGHEEYLKGQLRQVERLGRFVGEKMVLAVVQNFLEARHPGVRIWEEPAGIFNLRLTDELKMDIQAASPRDDIWIDRSRNRVLTFCFDGEQAYKHPDVELINVSHPFVKAAVASVSQQIESVAARAARGILPLAAEDDKEFANGAYLLLVFKNTIEGIRARTVLDTVCVSLSAEQLLPADASERLMHLTLERGIDWEIDRVPPRIDQAAWDRLVTEARRRNKILRESEKRENDALYVRRKSIIEAEFKHELSAKQSRLQTATVRGHIRIVPMIQGQLQKAEARFRARIAELDSLRQSSCPLSDPIAACIVEVVRS